MSMLWREVKPGVPRGVIYRLFQAGCVLTFFYIFGYAWVSDDAYITFRVVDNAVNGFGLRWNIDERVQVYTHPLWMLIHIPFYAIFHNIFLVTFAISAALSVAAVAALIRATPTTHLHKAALVLIPLMLSKSFKNHIVNGLEAPLLLFLLAWFWHDFIRTPGRIYRLMFIASLVMITRLDACLMVVLPLTWRVAVTRFQHFSPLKALKAFSPLIGWSLFSLFYYGFVFPNTKYAKLNTGISTSQYLDFGHCYEWEFTNFDRFSWLYIHFAFICAGITVVLDIIRFVNRRPLPAPFLTAPLMAMGMHLYMMYVVRVGGDFMDGRYYVPPFFMAVILVYTTLSRLPLPWVVLVCCYFLKVGYNRKNYDMRHGYSRHCGINSERDYYKGKQTLFVEGGFISNALGGNFTSRERIDNVMRFELWEARNMPDKWILPYNFKNYKKVVVSGYIGVWGFVQGPGLITIDNLALTDALLARLPRRPERYWRSGHYIRNIPDGYIQARQTGDTSQMDPSLRRYYEKLRLIISGPLWSYRRLKTIIAFNLGSYNEWRLRYIRSHK